MKISAYISYFYDFDMLMFCLERIYGLVDEIIIIDGPFKYITGDYNYILSEWDRYNADVIRTIAEI